MRLRTDPALGLMAVGLWDSLASTQQCSAAVQSSRCPVCAEQQCGEWAGTVCESDAA